MTECDDLCNSKGRLIRHPDPVYPNRSRQTVFLILLALLAVSKAEAVCYVLYDAAGHNIYAAREAPFSMVLPPSAEAEASRARGERLLIFDSRDCETASNPNVPRESSPEEQAAYEQRRQAARFDMRTRKPRSYMEFSPPVDRARIGPTAEKERQAENRLPASSASSPASRPKPPASSWLESRKRLSRQLRQRGEQERQQAQRETENAARLQQEQALRAEYERRREQERAAASRPSSPPPDPSAYPYAPTAATAGKRR